jgi:hypothetical protein
MIHESIEKLQNSIVVQNQAYMISRRTKSGQRIYNQYAWLERKVRIHFRIRWYGTHTCS